MKYQYIFLLLFATYCSSYAQESFDDPITLEYKADTDAIELLRQTLQEKVDANFIEIEVAIKNEYDKLLNKYYHKLLKQIKDSEGKENLRQSQRNWVKFKDSEKNFVLNFKDYDDDSHFEPKLVQLKKACYITKLTQKRTNEFYEYLIFYLYGI